MKEKQRKGKEWDWRGVKGRKGGRKESNENRIEKEREKKGDIK